MHFESRLRVDVLFLDSLEEIDGLMQRGIDTPSSRVVNTVELSEQVAVYPLT